MSMDTTRFCYSPLKSRVANTLALLVLAAARLHAGDGTEAKPNIVIILADDMGYGDPGCFNPHSKIDTPHIDSLAREGMRFTDAHAPGALCHPSRYGLITGRYPFRTDVSKWPIQPLIREGETTVATLLESQGYQTAMVGKWHLGFEEKGYDKPLRGGPMDHGFDAFFGLRASADIPPYLWIRGDRAVMEPTNHIAERHSQGWSSIQGAFLGGGNIAPDFVHSEVLPRITDEAINIIHSHQGKTQPLFLYLALTAPHTPWMPSAEFVGKSGAGMYGDFVMMVDTAIGRVLAALDQAGMVRNTLLIFTSDNGPVWYPNDIVKFGHDAEGGWRGMKADLWEAGHRMPFIVRWPGRVPAATLTDQTICFTDLLGTFADICGVKLEGQAGPDSFSFLPVLEGRQPEKQPIRGPIVIKSTQTGAMMVRDGPWVFINALGSGGFTRPSRIEPKPGDPNGQLFNLHDDPAEKHNLFLEQPDTVARLKAEMQKIIDSPVTRN